MKDKETIYKTAGSYTFLYVFGLFALMLCMLFLLVSPYYYCALLPLLALVFMALKVPMRFTISADNIYCRFLFKKRIRSFSDVLNIRLANGSKYSIRVMLITFQDKSTLSVSLGNQLVDLPRLLNFFDKQHVTIVKDKYWLERIKQYANGEYHLN